MSPQSPEDHKPQPCLDERAYTKIVATIGPRSEDHLPELIRAGMSVARINFSHGEADDHARYAEKIRAASKAVMIPVGILADIPGPKLRLGRFKGGKRGLKEGERVKLRQGSGLSKAGEVLLDFEGALCGVEPGHRVVLADGQVELVARDASADAVLAEVVRAGELGDRKGVHLPDSKVSGELPTKRDVEHIALARELGVDFLGISFVSKPEEVQRIRGLAPDMRVVSKIERAAALENLDRLIAESDGLMVARGDLGVEVELEELPLMQKMILKRAREKGRFTITATEMLESMVTSSRPTRAEVTDVANAVLDGTDALMLSAETAVGAHAVEAVATMTRIARAVERSNRYLELPRASFRTADANFSNATALAAVEAAGALGVDKIVCFTETGNTVRMISRYRPNAQVIGLSPLTKTIAQMTIQTHVRPILFRRESSLEEMLFMASEMLVVREMAQYGDEIIFVAGVPPGISQTTNVMKLHRIGEQVRLH